MGLHFLNYAETFTALQSRYPDLTDAELRMWVSGQRDLVALTKEPGKTRKLRLKYPACRFYWSGDAQDINALLDCWFPSKQIVRFVPSRRYLTYGQLVQRWQSRTLENIHTFIAERVNAFRNKSGFGFFDFGAFDPLGRLDLPMKDYVFALDQVEEMERKWFIEPAPRPQSQLRPFQAEDVRYFSRRLHWSEQIAGYLVQGCVRVDATGHYCYDDFPVVWTWPLFDAGTVQPPEADYIDLFSELSFPIEPLIFVEFCERRNIPLLSELVIKVKEIAGVSTSRNPSTDVLVLDDRPHPIHQETSKKDKVKLKRKKYKPELLTMENTALGNARNKAQKEATFEQFIEALDGLKYEIYSVIEKASVKDGVTWKDSDKEESETISAGGMRNRFTRAKKRNPYS